MSEENPTNMHESYCLGKEEGSKGKPASAQGAFESDTNYNERMSAYHNAKK